MYSYYKPHPCSYYSNMSMYNPYNIYNRYMTNPYNYWVNTAMHNPGYLRRPVNLMDYGPEPFTVNIEEVTELNTNFRTALWTGEHLQLTLMDIEPGDDIGLEIHPDHDQFIRIEEGQGMAMMGDERDNLNFQEDVYDGYAILIPAGKWHNIINTGNTPLKLYSIYAPPEHPHGTVQRTKEDTE